MQRYDPSTIEPKWQKIWAETKLYEVTEDSERQSIYATPMLPYPSGAGLHVGHVRNYSITDTYARWYRQRGYNVMSNIGWDSFGLPAENYAIKTGIPPWKSTQDNIANFKRQLKRLGMSYDWSREIDTSDPEYYRWTQWIFTELHKAGLAYQAESWQWWCPKCKTVLANEQVINGACWRHEDTPAVKKRLEQWFFKITDYAEELLDAIDDLDWPESIRTMQRNWIGKSIGAEVIFKSIPDSQHTTSLKIPVFTTRPDTLFGATFLVLAPEHPMVSRLVSQDQASKVENYVAEAMTHSDVERLAEDKPKSGVFTGAYALNPVNGQPVPIWVADYVLMGYGTGAIMGVPANDERDWEFAKTNDIPIVEIIKDHDQQEPREFGIEGEMINSGHYNGRQSTEVREQITQDLKKKKLASEKVNYRIRDWLISRQRYWGAPIPIIHCRDCGAVPVPEQDLPVKLPKIENFAPTGKAQSVLAEVDEWVNVYCPKCQGPAKRETDTMDGYACSSWYMLRYTDPHNQKQAWDPAKLNYWFPVDFYFGGDHAVSHLLYFRFWNHFFARQGWVDSDKAEPVKKLVYNGYINAADGSKMSKSKGNVVDPLEIIDAGYGADALRLYELFIGPYDQDVSWNTSGVPGTYRFLQRVWQLTEEFIEAAKGSAKTYDNQAESETRLRTTTHKTIRRITSDLERLSFNTAVAALMEYVNALNKLKAELPFDTQAQGWQEAVEVLLCLLAPFAPHITEELWQELGKDGSIHISTWPDYDEELAKEAMLTIVVQVNGKVRANLQVPAGTDMDSAVATAIAEPNVKKYLSGKPKKVIKVPEKLINFVV